MAREVARQLSWEVTDNHTEVVECWFEVAGERWQQTCSIHEEDEPSVRLGNDVMRRLVQAGCKWRDEAELEVKAPVEPRLEGANVEYTGEGCSDRG